VIFTAPSGCYTNGGVRDDAKQQVIV